jgi:hypothetical protein
MSKEPHIYREEYGKLLPLPEVQKPEVSKELNGVPDNWEAYKSWLESGITVSPELKLKDGGVYSLDEFKIEYRVEIRKGVWRGTHKELYDCYTGTKKIVAVPLPQGREDKPLSEEIIKKAIRVAKSRYPGFENYYHPPGEDYIIYGDDSGSGSVVSIASLLNKEQNPTVASKEVSGVDEDSIKEAIQNELYSLQNGVGNPKLFLSEIGMLTDSLYENVFKKFLAKEEEKEVGTKLDSPDLDSVASYSCTSGNSTGQWMPIDNKEDKGFIEAMASESDVLILYDNGEWRRWMEEDQPFAVSTHYMLVPKLNSPE